MKKILLVLIFFVTACSQDINYVENCADKKFLVSQGEIRSMENFRLELSPDKLLEEKFIKRHKAVMHNFKTFSLNEKLNTNNKTWSVNQYESGYKKCQNEYRKNKSLFEAKHSS